MDSLAAVAQELGKAQRLLLIGHIMPDGDCIGSMLALGLALEREGKEVTFALPGPVPSIYSFLPGVERIRVNPPATELGSSGDFDLIFIVDTSVPARLGELEKVVGRMREAGCRAVLLDHHVSGLPYADVNYIDPNAAAVGEIVHDLLKQLAVIHY